MSVHVWAAVVDPIRTVEAWNRNLPEFKRLTEQYGPECRKFLQDEAERRGYAWSKESKCYVHMWRMIACNHPGRLIGVGWRSGQLAAVFASDRKPPVRYESEATDIPTDTAQKLVNSLYPDSLYKKLIIDKGIKMVRVG